ncbi:MAG: amidohydrolase family protein [Xanthobacteraceae bacterium]
MRITRAVPCLLVTALLTLGAPPDSLAQAPATLLIKGATIIDGVADAPLRDRSLLIEGNAIREVLPADAAAPAGAQVLDLSGKFIIPGLFDSHVHREDYMGELFINHGVTSIVALENAPKALRAKSQDAQDLPRFFHPGGRLQLSNDTAEADIRQMVRTWLANEPDFAWFAQYNDRNSRAYAIAADEAHKAGFIIFGHTDNAPGSVRDGMDIIEHIWGFAEAIMSPEQLGAFKEGKFLTWATFLTDWSRLDAMIADAVRRGAYLNPTLHYEWGGMSRRALQRELEDYRVLSNPDLSYIPRNVVDGILGRQRQIKNFSSRYENTPWISRLPAQDRKEFEAGFQNVLEFTRRYVAAGGKIHAGTDTIAGGTPGLGMHHEMEMLVEAGLTPMQALKAATSWPAELLQGKNGARGTAKIGSIRPGNFADLVVVSADPMSDISNTKKIERVMKNGRWVELGYHPEYFTSVRPARPIVASNLAPTISAMQPNRVPEGSSPVHVVLEGSGFTTTSLVRIDGISVKTTFRNPKLLEFDLPASAVARASPDPFTPPGPAQNTGIIGYRSVAVHVFNPPPDGGTSNTVYQLVLPK